VYQGT